MNLFIFNKNTFCCSFFFIILIFCCLNYILTVNAQFVTDPSPGSSTSSSSSSSTAIRICRLLTDEFKTKAHVTIVLGTKHKKSTHMKAKEKNLITHPMYPASMICSISLFNYWIQHQVLIIH